MESSESRRFVYLLGAAVAIFAAIIGISFFAFRDVHPTANESQKLSESIPPSLTDVSNWKTYSNQKYTYSIKYPDPGPEFQKVNVYSDDLIDIRSYDGILIRIEPITTTLDDPEKWWNLQEIDGVSKLPTECFGHTTTTTSIKSDYYPEKTVVNFNKEVFIADNIIGNQIDRSCFPPQIRIIIIPHQGGLLRITYSNSTRAEQILSTFEFADQTDTLRWKTYNDIRYGYSIKYPSKWHLTPTAKEGYGAVAIIQSYNPENLPAKKGLDKNSIKIEISLLDKNGGLTFESWAKSQVRQTLQSSVSKDYGMRLLNESVISFGEVKGLQYEFSYKALSPSLHIFIPKNSTQVYQFSVYPANSVHMESFKNMLNTFRG